MQSYTKLPQPTPEERAEMDRQSEQLAERQKRDRERVECERWENANRSRTATRAIRLPRTWDTDR
jgi:hypothetical protein